MTTIRPLVFAALASLSALSPAGASTFISVDAFVQAGGAQEPSGGLVPLDGLLYGVTLVGGATGNGAIYRIDPATGAMTTLYSFRGEAQADGSFPVGQLAAAGGILYGATTFGGHFGTGTLFAFDPTTATETVLHEFGADDDGRWPAAGPIVAHGMLFGTTGFSAPTGAGVVFGFDLATGQESVLYRFSGPDGSAPLAPVTFADGQLYGTTWAGGDADTGVVFALDPRTGVETVLHVFAGPSSLTHPHAGLTWHAGVLYGTASAGGGSVDCADGCGGVFRIDAATGVEADLHVFASQAEGWLPQGELVFHRGHVFGTTASGGPSDFGTIFSVDVETGAKATLHDFVTTGQGITPGTLLGYQGALYGATHGGGSSGQGTVFRLER